MAAEAAPADGRRRQDSGFAEPLWRGIAAYRFASLVYAAIVVVVNLDAYARAWAGAAVVGVMTMWTVLAVVGYARPSRRSWPLLLADLLVTTTALASTVVVYTPAQVYSMAPITTLWVAGPVLSGAVIFGRRAAIACSLVLGLCDTLNRGRVDADVLHGVAILLLAGFALGYVSALASEAERRIAHAARLEAATRERERLARRIHDSVLQVLSLVQRRGSELGGEAAELGRLAGEQEAALRGLVGLDADAVSPSGAADLRAALTAHASASVTLSMPATPVELPARTVQEIDAAVAAALDNVARHCPPHCRAWVLLEDEPDAVTVTVRDDGPGIPDGRLAQAEADGRLGLAQSIRGRVRDLGGSVTVHTEPGSGTEIEFRVPRAA
ncbi:MacS family sensor histidine kinase [Allonocardiopsis opalescens]|uniref:Signal transduction histidine kinase n=1 Tax=Allonocardiopsis opalescens TaxID=1144618 RepID=A0A2T0PZP8_9ACTN|nr:DUF5931 domain-containing protein [Allonocardiopsis opalescens]PRX97020.1 signal transduction histidine kinase [Allonocardiopsis opalescens]